MSFLNLLRGGVDTATRAKAAGQQAEMQTLPLIVQLKQMAAQRQMQQQEFGLKTRLGEAQIKNYESEVAHRGEVPDAFDTVTSKDGIYDRNKRTGTLRRLSDPESGSPLTPRPQSDPMPFAPAPTVGADGVTTTGSFDRRTGTTTPGTVPKPADRAQQPTEFERKAGLLAPRAVQAAEILDEFYTKGAPATSKLSGVPLIGNYMLSDDEQRMVQAAEEVSTAILRLESGAAISEHEVKSYAKQFLPVPGDGPEVLQQKRAALQTAVAQITEAAGRAAPKGATAPAGAPSTSGNPFEDLVPKGKP